jgi:hypothetical protein
MRYPAGFISAFYNPLKNPDAPTIGTASAISGGISVAFTAPSNVGGSAITSYTATAKRTSDGVLFTASGASSPITVTGLTEVAFTATVVAVNSYGPSASSAASNSVTPLPAIGSVFGGGFFAGQISTAGNSIADYNLVVAPLSTGQTTPIQWKTNTTGGDPSSVIDGPANSAAMDSPTYPAAQFCEGLTIGGFTDWYMPAKNELEICYYNLKPTTVVNNTTVGTNANAVPARASNYTAGTPAQTSATVFQTGNAQYFSSAFYWSSSAYSVTTGSVQSFSTGFQTYSLKTNSSYRYVRAVRRVAV